MVYNETRDNFCRGDVLLGSAQNFFKSYFYFSVFLISFHFALYQKEDELYSSRKAAYSAEKKVKSENRTGEPFANIKRITLFVDRNLTSKVSEFFHFIFSEGSL